MKCNGCDQEAPATHYTWFCGCYIRREVEMQYRNETPSETPTSLDAKEEAAWWLAYNYGWHQTEAFARLRLFDPREGMLWLYEFGSYLALQVKALQATKSAKAVKVEYEVSWTTSFRQRGESARIDLIRKN